MQVQGGGGGEGETVKYPFQNLKCTFKEKGLEWVGRCTERYLRGPKLSLPIYERGYLRGPKLFLQMAHINYPDSRHSQGGLEICHTNFTST